MSQPRITIIGAGRMGQGLGLALKRRGYKVVLLNRSSRDVVPPLVLHQGSKAEATADAELILIATPDDAIGSVAIGNGWSSRLRSIRSSWPSVRILR